MKSKRWSHTPKTDAVWHGLRKHDITSTESAALFDMSPYATRFELYYRKRDKVTTELSVNDRMLWGQRLEDTIAQGIAEDQGVRVRRMNKYVRIVAARMGASFDYEVVGLVDEWQGIDTEMRRMYREHGVGNLEIKAVDYMIFSRQWTVNEDKSIEAPAHIEIQVQHQLHVSDRSWSAIGVLVSGNTPKILIRMRDAEVGAVLESKCIEFFKMVRAGTPPEPSYPVDAEFVKKVYGFADPETTFDATDNNEFLQLCMDYDDARIRFSKADGDKKVAQAKLFQLIGRFEKAFAQVGETTYKISAGMVAPAPIEAYERNGYRNFRLTISKPKEKNASQK